MSIYGIQFDGGEELLDDLGPHKRGAGRGWVGRFSKLDLGALEALLAEAWRRGPPATERGSDQRGA